MTQETPAYRWDGKLRSHSRNSQFVYTLSGEGIFQHLNQKYRLTKGKAFLAQIRDPETSYYYPLNSNIPWIFIWITFYGETVDMMVADIVKKYGYIYDIPENNSIVKTLKAYKGIRGTVQAITPLSGTAIVMDVLTGINSAIGNDFLNNPQNRLVKNVREFVMQNIDKEISIKDLADQLKVSREHLARTFKKRTGVSPNEYITYEKLRLACQLLKVTNLSCKEIAQRVGYRNQSSFTRIFNRLLQQSPKNTRETGHYPPLIH